MLLKTNEICALKVKLPQAPHPPCASSPLIHFEGFTQEARIRHKTIHT